MIFITKSPFLRLKSVHFLFERAVINNRIIELAPVICTRLPRRGLGISFREWRRVDELNWKSFPGETIAILDKMGTRYKFTNLLQSHINYCVLVI